MPQISIVVPVFNSSAYLGRCLDSLATQAHRDVEVIAVDDGSEDDSWAIIEKFAGRDARFSRSLRTTHRGLGPARNRGLEIAHGEFVAFVDSDDYIDPDYCAAPCALACARDADLVCFGSWWEYPDHKVLHRPTVRVGMTPRQALLHMTPMVCEKLYRRQFLQSRRLDFPAIFHEDEVFTPMVMACAPRIALLDRPLYHYVRREGSICGLGVNPNSADVLQAFRLLIDHSRAWPQFRHELEFHAVRILSWTAFRWQSCSEDWSIRCRREAARLLGSIVHPGSDNPYLRPRTRP